jgi:hypothetical protein
MNHELLQMVISSPMLIVPAIKTRVKIPSFGMTQSPTA